MKKLLSVFLSVLLVIQLVVPVWAAEPAAETDLSAPETAVETAAADAALAVGTRVSGVQNNPLYGEGAGGPVSRITARQLYAAGTASADDYFTEETDVVETIAAGMEKRNATITVPWCIRQSDAATDSQLEAMILAAFALAVSHTGAPTRGDSLLWAYESVEYSGEVVEEKDGYCYVKATYKLRYYTTAAQEKELTTKLEQVMASFNFTEETNVVTKIETIYRYICKNVSYDNTHANDKTYTLKFTPYAALVKGKAVCQGYALLLYRMLLMAGVDNRVISGVANGVGHAWNIAAVNNFYYNLDSTWDAGAADYSYLLRNPEMFPNHTRDAVYDTAEFHAFYPMGRDTYPTTDIWTVFAGGCGENVMWELTNNGILTISGSGAMNDYADKTKAPWYDQRNYILGVVVKEGVTHVGDYAFAEYPSLYAVSVASGSVGKLAFYKCNALLAVDLLEGVTNVGQQAFDECASLVAVSCAAETIGRGAFQKCESLSVVELLEGVKEIGLEAFDHCTDFSISFPTTMEKVDNAFFGCSGVEVHITDLAAWCGIQFSFSYANPIYEWQGLLYLNGELITDLVIPEGVTAIGDYAFDCRSITSVTFPKSLTSIGTGAFHYSGIEKVTIPGTVTTFGNGAHGAFEGSARLTSVTLEDGLTVLGRNMFKDCGQLETVNVNNTLQQIGDTAFYNCTKLRGMTLPETVNYIGWSAFAQCYEMDPLTFTGDAPTFGTSCFRGVAATAYYPINNPTWTEEVRQQYGGTITWKAICAGPHTFVDGVCTVCGVKEPGSVTRIFGADRYETAFKTAEVLKQQLGVEKFDNIVVACGDNFADALGGSYLAAKKNAPILLVKSSKIDAVKSYIKANLNPGGTVYLLGGTAAIPAAMDTGLDGFNVKRLAGATRYDTNLLILEEAGVTNEDILICTGKSFADSLSAAAAGRPLLLVKDSLNDSQKAFLQSHAANKKYILGGTAAVSTSVENQAKAYGTVKRIGGNTRYETSVLIAQEFFPDATQAALAYAQNFPDGLSGGALAYAMKAPLVLTASGKEAAAAAYAKEQGITSGVIFGGNVLISDKAVRTIFQMQSGDVIKLG
ncbi:MAG: leucine-rich repeat protein [Clostridia bacterium]|nr:leucine-rich repeat protein [Clostridia bacterium]